MFCSCLDSHGWDIVNQRGSEEPDRNSVKESLRFQAVWVHSWLTCTDWVA